MKILLSAYACEPNKGSEPGVGWNWTIEISKRGHEVTVLTRRNNRENIEKSGYPKGIQFWYYDLPDSLIWMKRFIGVHVYYFIWQLVVFFKFKRNIKETKFDCIHHLTFVAIRKISFLAFLNVPFYYGPLGGGEYSPNYLVKALKFKYRIKEAIRNVLNNAVRFNLLSILVFKRAKAIFVTSEQTLSYVPNKFHVKTRVFSAIGIHDERTNNNMPLIKNINKPPKLLYVGQFLYWKGMDFLLDVLKELSLEIDFNMTLVGKGPMKSEVQKKIKLYNLTAKVIVKDWMQQSDLETVYRDSDLFLFFSLHDSGGMVVQEALSYNLPVVCFDIGGPGLTVSNDVGLKIALNKEDNYISVVKTITQQILNLLHDNNTLYNKKLAINSYIRKLYWKTTVDRVYSVIEADYMKKHEQV